MSHFYDGYHDQSRVKNFLNHATNDFRRCFRGNLQRESRPAIVTAVCQVNVNRATVATGSVVDGGSGFWVYYRNWYSDL